MTWIERQFQKVIRLPVHSPDRIVLARLATAALFLPIVVPIFLWRQSTWRAAE